MIDVGNLQPADLLSKEEIEALLPVLDEIISWAKQIQEYALSQALKGVNYKGYKVVEGRAYRRFTDEQMVVDTLLGEGYEEAMLYERKLLSLSNIEKLIGKKEFNNLLSKYVEVPQGKPTLVPETDKRPAFKPEYDAAEDFSEPIDE